MNLLGLGLATLAATSALCLASPALAADFYAEGAVSGGASSWEGDPDVQAALHTGFEFVDVVSVDVAARMGYGAVDERLLMMLGLGTKLALPIEPFIPHLRLTALHAHESPVAAMQHDPFLHVLGVGDGIRHRFGFEAALGASYLFAVLDHTKFLAQVEAYADAFPDDGKGPVFYGGAGMGLGLQYGI